MKVQTPSLLKFAKLKRKLAIGHWQAVGLLESIWLFTQQNAPAGDIGKFSDEDIAIAIDWLDDPEKMINALVECRWLDRSERHRLVVHDWETHVPKWVKGNLIKSGVAFAGSETEGQANGGEVEANPVKDDPYPVKEAPKDSKEAPYTVKGPSPNLTYPNQSKPNPTTPTDADASECAKATKRKPKKPKADEHPLFEKFWQAYPRKENKPKARKAFREIESPDELLNTILVAIERQKVNGCLVPNSVDGRSTIPHPSTWLNDERWTDEPLPTATTPSTTTTKPPRDLTDAERMAVVDTVSERLLGGAA